MARVKVSRELALKGFVMSLKETFGGGGNNIFIRENVDAIAKKTGQLGFITFATVYGKLTRVRQGVYTIPDSWMNGESPWDGITEVIPVAKVEKTKKVAVDGDVAPKAKRAKKTVEPEVVEVAETITTTVKKNIEKNNKKALTKKELFEKAKAEIAKKKAKTADATETSE
jgi:hypothetical protein